MSAFIISTETMHRVIAAIDEKHQREGIFGADFETAAPGYLVRSCADLETLGNELFAMNCRAVNQRYLPPSQIAPPYRYRPIGKIKPVEQFAAIACLLYQCSEGNVPDEPLYKALNRLKGSLACELAHDAMRTAKTPWDWPEKAAA